mmetsp:Transcript_42960/g.90247  ORF Transcript_42960/g.90247 Transcript_42960/m.90247 type:complete len:226 (-) Transcript_42960:1652-2329(-)
MRYWSIYKFWINTKVLIAFPRFILLSTIGSFCRFWRGLIIYHGGSIEEAEGGCSRFGAVQTLMKFNFNLRSGSIPACSRFGILQANQVRPRCLEMAVSLVIIMHALKPHTLQCPHHVCRILVWPRVISRVRCCFSLTNLDRKHTLFTEPIVQGIDKMIVLVEIAHYFNKLIRIQCVHYDYIKFLFLAFAISKPIYEPFESVLVDHCCSRIVKARICIASCNICTV